MPHTASLNETMFVGHLRAPLNMTVLDMAKLAAVFETEFPLPQQVAPSAPINLDQPAQINFAFSEMPRLILRSTTTPFALSIQNDRFSFSWVRRNEFGSIVDYPGFDYLVVEWLKRLNLFEDWHRLFFKTQPQYKIVELTYINALPLMKLDGEQRRLSEVFKFISPGNRPVNSFQANWSELLEKKPDSARVLASIGVGLLPSQDSQTAAEPGMFFNFSGYAPIKPEDSQPSTMSDLIDSLHRRILDVYNGSIRSEAA